MCSTTMGNAYKNLLILTHSSFELRSRLGSIFSSFTFRVQHVLEPYSTFYSYPHLDLLVFYFIYLVLIYK